MSHTFLTLADMTVANGFTGCLTCDWLKIFSKASDSQLELGLTNLIREDLEWVSWGPGKKTEASGVLEKEPPVPRVKVY